jgi:hypothetical protein
MTHDESCVTCDCTDDDACVISVMKVVGGRRCAHGLWLECFEKPLAACVMRHWQFALGVRMCGAVVAAAAAGVRASKVEARRREWNGVGAFCERVLFVTVCHCGVSVVL